MLKSMLTLREASKLYPPLTYANLAKKIQRGQLKAMKKYGLLFVEKRHVEKLLGDIKSITLERPQE